MAFDFNSLSRSSGTSPAPIIFTYKTDDANAVVLTSGYFNGGFTTFRVDDYVFVRNTDDDYIVRVVSSSKQGVVVELLISLAQTGSAYGWVNIQDNTRTTGAPLVLAATVRTKLTINADSTIDTYAPTNTVVSDYFDVATSKIKGVAVGDAYMYRLTFKARPNNATASIAIDYDIGGSQGIISDKSIRLLKGNAVPTSISEVNMVFTLDTYIANGAEIYLTGTHITDIYDIRLLITKLA